MALGPALLIADEPTTALDVTVQAQMLELLSELQDELGIAIMLITHDLGVVAELADQVVVMYGGRVVEQADRRELSTTRRITPTRAGCSSRLPVAGDRARLRPDPGPAAEHADRPPPGCPFRPRCPLPLERCETEAPPLRPIGSGAARALAAGPRPMPVPPPGPVACRRAGCPTTWPGRSAAGYRPSSRGRPRGDAGDAGAAASPARADRIVKHFPVRPARRLLTPRRAVRARGRRRQPRGPPGRDARPGRRDRLREVDAGPCIAPAAS